MKLSSKQSQLFYMSLIAGIYMAPSGLTTFGAKYAPSTALRIVKHGSPESFGLTCRNHKKTNNVRFKAKQRAIKAKQPK